MRLYWPLPLIAEMHDHDLMLLENYPQKQQMINHVVENDIIEVINLIEP